MKAYASYTGTLRNLAALRAAGWGLVLTPYHNRDPKGFPYMIDNGRWTLHQIETAIRDGRLPPDMPPGSARYPEEMTLEETFDLAFDRLMMERGPGADFAVIPDIVASPHSLELSLYHLYNGWMWDHCRTLLLPVQNGMTAEQIQPHIGMKEPGTVGIFIGGDTAWKLATMPSWCALARSAGVPCHVGRVNTQQRIRMALEAGATSIDGSSASRYETTLKDLDDARKGLLWVTRGRKKGQLRMF